MYIEVFFYQIHYNNLSSINRFEDDNDIRY